MVYTFKIDDSSPKAKKFIDLLKLFKDDVNFIEIDLDEDLSSIDTNIDKELSRRYKLFVDDSSGKDWEILRKAII